MTAAGGTALVDGAREPATDSGSPRVARPAPTRARRVILPWALLALAALCWLVSLPSLVSAPISQFGLLAAGSPLFLAAIVVIHLAFVCAVRRRDVAAALATVLSLVVVERLTVTLVTEVPPYSWTYKHLGVVDFIATNGELARGVDVYQGWPGLFAATAWFSDVVGVSPITLAHWFTPLIHVAYIGVAIVMARAWGADRVTAVVVAFLVESLNWVGQDYFSPQATVFLLGMAMLALLGLSRDNPRLIWFALAIYTAIVITHQLTPYWLLGLTTLLVISRRLRPWWLPVAMGVIVVAFTLYNLGSIDGFTLFSADPLSNAQSNIATTGVLGQQVTSLLVRVLSVSMWTAAALSAVLERRAGRPVLARAVIAFSPFAILLGQGYGGEAIFRVFLYSVPGCALLIAPRVIAACTAVPTVLGVTKVVASGVAVVVGGVAAAQGFFGGWSANLMTNDQVEFSTRFLEQVEYPAYLSVAAPVWPERPTGRYVEFARFQRGYDYPLIYAAELVGAHFSTESDYDKFLATIEGRVGGPTYLILSEQMKVYDWYFGILPLDALDNLEGWVAQDPRWVLVEKAGQFTIYRAAGAMNKGSERGEVA